MRYSKLLWLLLPAAMLTSCANNTESYIATADSVVMANDITAINSPSRKIVHTADVRCRVPDVYKAVDTLERMVNALDGMIAESVMENQINASQTIRYKADSQKTVQTYTTTAHLTLRVPTYYIDTMMRQVPMLASFIDSRTMQRTDVTLQYLSNAMKNEAAGVAPPAIADKKHGGIKKNPQQSAINPKKIDTVIDRRIANLQMLDDVNYATLRIDLYQPEKIDVLITADTRQATVIPFASRIGMALTDGWQFFKLLLIGFVSIWPLWLMLIMVWVGYRAYKKSVILTK
ncbi:hypothetical protein CAP35_11160 [Chitinophagaceae bacterium IBVUCB1]|nr:hypothetical protein CAP35_11160 [Chitinophagaceae bacterium IBVUCB1]